MYIYIYTHTHTHMFNKLFGYLMELKMATEDMVCLCFFFCQPHMTVVYVKTYGRTHKHGILVACIMMHITWQLYQ